jgi:four helix bundle protein
VEEGRHWAWTTVMKWGRFERETVGSQLVRACDSIGANLVEGDGRYSPADALRFFHIARASAREARYWITCAQKRGLVEKTSAEARIRDLTEATRALNALIRYRRAKKFNNRVSEPPAPTYGDTAIPTADPFAEPEVG